MKRLSLGLALSTVVLGATACTPELKPDEVLGTLFKDKGQLGGYALGDSWDSIKKDHDPKLEVRDDADIKQLRRDLSSPGDNGFYLTFGVDKDNKVERLGAAIYGRKQNAVTVRKLLDNVRAHYDKAYGPGKCLSLGDESHTTACDWTGDGKPTVHIHYQEYKDPIAGSIDLEISPTTKK